MRGSSSRPCDPHVADRTARHTPGTKTEEQAERELARLRWPDGPVCPFCGAGDIYVLHLRTVNRRRYKCRECRRQFSVTKGTILEGSKLSLGAWIRLVQILCEGGDNLSANAVSRELNVSYRTVRNIFDRLAYAAKRQPFAAVIEERAER